MILDETYLRNMYETSSKSLYRWWLIPTQSYIVVLGSLALALSQPLERNHLGKNKI